MRATETSQDPSSPITLMYWSQVCCYPATLKTCALRLVLCYVVVAGSAVPSTLHEFASLSHATLCIIQHFQGINIATLPQATLHEH